MTTNPLYAPAEMGLQIVGTLEEPGLSYAFHTIGLWLHTETGKYYAARDRGCSCPTPFDAMTLGNMSEIPDAYAFAAYVATQGNKGTWSQRDVFDLAAKIVPVKPVPKVVSLAQEWQEIQDRIADDRDMPGEVERFVAKLLTLVEAK